VYVSYAVVQVVVLFLVLGFCVLDVEFILVVIWKVNCVIIVSVLDIFSLNCVFMKAFVLTL
jgi:hypothetical protein